ncbi:MAG: aspartate kinase [Candidatus Acidiferrales bacterium]
MQILKFGGSSLADAAAVQVVARLVREHARNEETVVVCSACAGVTDRLARVAQLVSARNSAQALTEVSVLRSNHRALLASLDLGTSAREAAAQANEAPCVGKELEELGSCLQALVAGTELHNAGAAWTDAVLSYGERASTRLMAHALRQAEVAAQAVEATRFLMTDNAFQNAAPLWEETRHRARATLLPLIEKGIVPVVTGFIGATLSGEVTTLGRNSSDFSAAILADVLNAGEVWLWTDVDGIYDRDPRGPQVSRDEVALLESLTYDEALRLAERGAKVLHPRTIEPLRQKKIALRIRNTFRPEHPGTRIGPAVRSVTR